MFLKTKLLTILAASTILVALGFGAQQTGPGVYARSPAHTRLSMEANPPDTDPERSQEVTIPYPGRLTDANGQPVPDGAYDFTFSLYDSETGGVLLWSETQTGVVVQNGAFNVWLGSAQPLPSTALEGGSLWLEVAVRGPDETVFTALAPRQLLSTDAPTSPDSPSAPPSCPHDHFGESWIGATGLPGLEIKNTGGGGIIVNSFPSDPSDVCVGVYAMGDGIWGTGVKGTSDKGEGVYGSSGEGIGVYALSYRGSGKDHAALRAINENGTHGMAAYLTNKSDYHTAHVDNSGIGGVLWLQNNGNGSGAGGGEFITAVSRDYDVQFLVLSSGEVRSDVGFNTPAGDFAEMLPAVAGLQPGEVLVIGSNGKLTRSTEPYQVSVVGVYSTRPGFVGGRPVEGDAPGTIPLAIVGVVPVRVSTENGAIQPGDLLVASSTPGHAMKASPNPPQGTVIGKALEPLDVSQGTGLIMMLVTLQ